MVSYSTHLSGLIVVDFCHTECKSDKGLAVRDVNLFFPVNVIIGTPERVPYLDIVQDVVVLIEKSDSAEGECL